MPTCVQKPSIKKPRRKSTASSRAKKRPKNKHVRTKSSVSAKSSYSDDSEDISPPKSITVSFINPLVNDSLQIVPLELYDNENFPLYATDLLTKVCKLTLEQTMFFHLAYIRELRPKTDLFHPEPIYFVSSHGGLGNACVSTSLLTPNALYALGLHDLRESDIYALSEDELNEIRALFMSLMDRDEIITEDQIIHHCWETEKEKLEELRKLHDETSWDELREQKKARTRLAIVLRSWKHADLNKDRKLSWDEFLLYEAQRRKRTAAT